MKTHHNLRNFTRSKVTVGAIVTVAGKEPFDVELIDLSMSGMFIVSPTSLTMHDSCTVHILLGHIEHELPIIAQATVVRVTQDGIALKFSSVKLDSSDSLKHLVLANSDNPDKTRDEFTRLGFWMFNSDL